MPSGVQVMAIKREDSKDAMTAKHKEEETTAAATDSHGDGATDESVEVVLGSTGNSTVVETPERPSAANAVGDPNIFRQPQAVRPRPVRSPHHPPYPVSGSWGYYHGEYPPPPHAAHVVPPRPPYPGHNPSTSFEEHGPPPYHHHHPHHPPPPPHHLAPHHVHHLHSTPHYSPHVQYPPPRYPSEQVNVISPNQKAEPSYHAHPPPPSSVSRTRHSAAPYYQYPPTSPVSRPGSSYASSAPPRLRNYAMRRGENGAYGVSSTSSSGRAPPRGGATDSSSAASVDPYHRDESMYPRSSYPPRPPVVADSFDSDHHPRGSHGATSGNVHAPNPKQPQQHHNHHHHGASATPGSGATADPYAHFYEGGGSWGSFDSSAPPPQPPPPQFDDHRYYGFPPPDSPYSSYAYSPGAIQHSDSFPGPYGNHPPLSFSYSYDDQDGMHEYGGIPPHDLLHPKHVTPPGAGGKAKSRTRTGTPLASNTTTASGDSSLLLSHRPRSANGSSTSSHNINNGRNMLLPKAAEEIDFDVTDPPMEPVTPKSEKPVCESLTDVNPDDVLLGRGGGTNSQVGNRRFRKLVQDFQPTYLMAKRKEKPLLARTIVLIIRKRGGRFLKKNEETGEMFEVGDTKAEAKTSQALREGLDVRATRSAVMQSDKKKKKNPKSPGTPQSSNSNSCSHHEETSPSVSPMGAVTGVGKDRSVSSESPPTLPKFQGEDDPDTPTTEKVPPPSPGSPVDRDHFRKRRRMRSMDRFFPDFCPPRADLARPTGHHSALADCDDEDVDGDDGVLEMTSSPAVAGTGSAHRRHTGSPRDEHMHYDTECAPVQGCAGIALDLMTGAATGSFCLAPPGWRRS